MKEEKVFIDGNNEEMSLRYYKGNCTIELMNKEEILNSLDLAGIRTIQEFLLDAIDRIERNCDFDDKDIKQE